MSIYVPAYYPSDSSSTSTQTWNDFVGALPDYFSNGGTPVTVIVNGSASEPDALYNPILAAHVSAIQAKGNLVLGYVDWKPKTTTCGATQPLHDCNGRWESELPIPCTGPCIAQYTLDNMYRWNHTSDSQSYYLNGFFIDDAQRSDLGDLLYSELIAASAPHILQQQAANTLFNPGTYFPVLALRTYVDCHLQNVRGFTEWVDLENPASTLDYDHSGSDPLASDFEWAASYYSWHFVHLGYGFSLGGNWPQILDETMTTVSGRNAAGVFITDKSGWSTPPDPTLFARQYNNGNTLSYQFNDTDGDTPHCTGACDPNACMTCTCPGPVQVDAQVTSDSGSGFCAVLNVTNFTGSRINSWAASVQIDDAILSQGSGATFYGTSRVLLVASPSPIDPGHTDSSVGFCVTRQTPGSGVSALAAIGSP